MIFIAMLLATFAHATSCLIPKVEIFPKNLYKNERFLYLIGHKKNKIDFRHSSYYIERAGQVIPLTLLEMIEFPYQRVELAFKLSSNKLADGVYIVRIKDAQGKAISMENNSSERLKIVISKEIKKEVKVKPIILDITTSFDFGLNFRSFIDLKTNLKNSAVKAIIKNQSGYIYNLFGYIGEDGRLRVGKDGCDGDIGFVSNHQYSIQLQRVSVEGFLQETSDVKVFFTQLKK